MQRDTCLVAVVDDEVSVRKALGRLIRAAGFGVELHASGVDFLQSLQEHHPDCVVLDVRMPVLSGFDVLAALARRASPVPAVIITGDDSPESRDRALRHGALAYLRKPVDESMLVEAIQGAIRDVA